MKLKTILIIAGVVIFISLLTTVKILNNQRLKEKAEKEHWQRNYTEQADYNKRNTEIVYKQGEFIGQLSDSLKSLLSALDIKPKTIVKIIEKTNILRDTSIREVPVSPLRKDEWKIFDKEKCWTWEGIARIEGDSISVKRIGFDYHNLSLDIYSKKLKWKFLFLRRYYRNEIVQTSTSECGSSVSRTITVVKK
jgi:hypothetical protein